ncbi:MAG: mannitol dehydrogenase family protein [Aestuariivirga sp.]|nr:mannitol dehydrogenase family protein [Aestuariivirga sp.]
MTRLSRATLHGLSPGIAMPNYQASDLRPGILHFGLGNFHRAHQAVYLDRLFNAGRSRDFAVIGTGVRPADRAMHDALKPQDWLTTVVEQEADESVARVTGAMLGMIPPEERASILRQLADPAIRIVSITVTEGGYFIDPATGQFNPEFPEIAHDGKNPDDPQTVFGLIARGLKMRREAGTKPFTVMSCDNIPHNGVVARNAVAGVARLYDRGLADWIAASAAFPNGMVDRITPATTERERGLLAQDYGIADSWPVYCEAFIQWVLEDDFCNGRPVLEEAGVQFVPDVTPFEFMKIRILNGGHAAIAYPASLLDIHFVHDAMTHPLVSAFFAKIEREEIMPTVPPVPGVVLEDYYRLIHRRFANPKIGDTIPRLAFDGSNRQPKFIVPVARDRLKQGRSVDALAFESALWCRHCAGKTETGREITAGDPNWARLNALAGKARSEPLAWLSMDDVYGDVGTAPAFRNAFAASLTDIWTKGTARALADFVGA